MRPSSLFEFETPGEGAAKVSPNITWGRGVSKNVMWQFLLAISLEKVDKNLCHVTQGKGEAKCHIGGGGGPKKCGKSVTYYLTGPLGLGVDEDNFSRSATWDRHCSWTGRRRRCCSRTSTISVTNKFWFWSEGSSGIGFWEKFWAWTTTFWRLTQMIPEEQSIGRSVISVLLRFKWMPLNGITLGQTQS